jgi:hypothetical protein
MSIRRLVMAAAICSLPVLASTAGQSASATEPPDNDSCTVNLATGAVRCSTGALGDLSASAAGETKLVTVYEHSDYGGKKLTFTGTNGDCSAGTGRNNYLADDLRKYKRGLFRNWNDAISSVVTHGRCDVQFFADINYKGSYTHWIKSSSNLTSFNDLASSFVLS